MCNVFVYDTEGWTSCWVTIAPGINCHVVWAKLLIVIQALFLDRMIFFL